MCVPTAAILGDLILTSFVISPATFKVPNTPCDEPILIWFVNSMPTGSCKTTVYRYFSKRIREKAQCKG